MYLTLIFLFYQESFEVDEEGFRIRPKDADKIAKFSGDESSHDDSSDFESDSDNGNNY